MLEFQKDLDMFQQALDIQDPWFVSYREFDKEQEQLHIYLNFKRGAKFMCSNCGSANNPVHDVLNEDRTWRHLNFFQYQTIIHARLPRVACKSCRKIHTIHVPWARPSAGFSWNFEAYALSLMKEMPVAAVARQIGEHDTRLWRIFKYYVQKSIVEIDLTNVKRVAIDETSSRRGHRYVTLFLDIDSKRVLFVIEGKGSEGLAVFEKLLLKKGVPTKQIQEFSCDMSSAFIKGIEEHFPNANITFDKFHVMEIVNEAVDQVRKAEQKEQPLLKKSKYLCLKMKKNYPPMKGTDSHH